MRRAIIAGTPVVPFPRLAHNDSQFCFFLECGPALGPGLGLSSHLLCLLFLLIQPLGAFPPRADHSLQLIGCHCRSLSQVRRLDNPFSLSLLLLWSVLLGGRYIIGDLLDHRLTRFHDVTPRQRLLESWWSDLTFRVILIHGVISLLLSIISVSSLLAWRVFARLVQCALQFSGH